METEVLMQARGVRKEFKATGKIVHAVSGVDMDIYKGRNTGIGRRIWLRKIDSG